MRIMAPSRVEGEVPVFTRTELAHFIEHGWIVVRGAFSEEVAAAGRAFMWRVMGLDPDDPTTWRRPSIHVRRNFTGPPFDRVLGCRLRGALDTLMGRGRAVIHDYFGWWPILFPGSRGPGGWHVDGSDFHHHVTSGEQGLVTLFLFSDAGPGDGATPVLPGSHLEVARLLAAAEPHGLSFQELHARLPRVDAARCVEMTGRAGDVVCLHPFLVHGVNANGGCRVRFACNPRYWLRAPLELEREDGDYSPVELAIRLALGRQATPVLDAATLLEPA